jgi:5'-deoxynucleotidase YfbR-like HD superfamily hydrolase
MIRPTDNKSLTRQINFILEADKLKAIIRNTLLTDRSRFENAAEHSWHAALTAVVIFDTASVNGIDLAHIVKMLLVHDLVEIDAGDTFCYSHEQRQTQMRREQKAAERIFGLLPDKQAHELRQLWREFEARQTPEARFANAVDRLQPLLQAIQTQGKTWRENQIRKGQVIERMQPVRTALPLLWGYVMELIEDAADKGYLIDDGQ